MNESEKTIPDKTPDELTEHVIPFTAGDGLELNVINIRGKKEPTRCPVLLVHGAGVRANIFRAPINIGIVEALINDGYDVWLENWRASIDIKKSQWSLDEAAVYDHPYAVKKVIEETGAKKIKAIVHCQGSTSFTMAAIAGLLPDVDTIISNAVSLHPVPPKFSRFKLRFAVPFVSLFTPYLNPHWGVKAEGFVQKSIVAVVKLFHHECDNTSCKLVSFSYGTGFPALWLHENINEETHEWIKEEFKNVPMSFFKDMNQYVMKGNLLGVNNLKELPKDFTLEKPKTDARFIFFTGDKNLCFIPESQHKSFAYFDQIKPNYHSIYELKNYSHLDIFMGTHAYKDVFPLMLNELNQSK